MKQTTKNKLEKMIEYVWNAICLKDQLTAPLASEIIRQFNLTPSKKWNIVRKINQYVKDVKDVNYVKEES